MTIPTPTPGPGASVTVGTAQGVGDKPILRTADHSNPCQQEKRLFNYIFLRGDDVLVDECVQDEESKIAQVENIKGAIAKRWSDLSDTASDGEIGECTLSVYSV